MLRGSYVLGEAFSYRDRQHFKTIFDQPAGCQAPVCPMSVTSSARLLQKLLLVLKHPDYDSHKIKYELKQHSRRRAPALLVTALLAAARRHQAAASHQLR
jgi:hypothetical protein